MEIRPCKIKYICLHHTAGNEKDTQAVRQAHLNQGWGDIGYNAVVEKNGTIGIGRDIKYSGAHSLGKAPDGSGYTMNQAAYAISHIGNFEKDVMSEVQFQASIKFCAQKCKELGIVPSKQTIRRHKDDYATACPGKNFPYDRYIAEVIKIYNGEVEPVAVENKSKDPDTHLIVWVRESKVEQAIKDINKLGFAAAKLPLDLSKMKEGGYFSNG